ncbi:MAG: hypothetical protein ABI678_00425 [Kofleriaceae bacterium]
MSDASLGLVIGFVLVVLATLGFVILAVRSANRRAVVPVVAALAAWLVVTAIMAARGAYDRAPVPGPLAAGGPLLAATVIVLLVPAGRRFLAQLPLQTLTYLHVVRVGVEFVLFGLAIDHLLPTELTFAGRNFDIAVGFTAPIVAALAFAGGKPARGTLIVWNVIALGLLVHIVGAAIGSHSHIVLEWPFIWLPGFVVPIVASTHLVTLWRLAKR